MKYNTTGEITADRARSLVSQRRNSDSEVALKKIFARIEDTATRGGQYIQVDFYNDLGGEAETVKIVTEKLQERGFLVNHQQGSDCRDGDSWNYLHVSWNITVK